MISLTAFIVGVLSMIILAGLIAMTIDFRSQSKKQGKFAAASGIAAFAITALAALLQGIGVLLPIGMTSSEATKQAAAASPSGSQQPASPTIQTSIKFAPVDAPVPFCREYAINGTPDSKNVLLVFDQSVDSNGNATSPWYLDGKAAPGRESGWTIEASLGEDSKKGDRIQLAAILLASEDAAFALGITVSPDDGTHSWLAKDLPRTTLAQDKITVTRDGSGKSVKCSS